VVEKFMNEQRCALDRRHAVASLLKSRQEALVISGLGSSTYDVHAAGDCDANYYLWGAMGSAALVGYGLAQATKRAVWVITGDGEQLMGLGGLATVGIAKPKNLTIIVIDNEHFGETGMQVSHTGRGIALNAVAGACGFAKTGMISDQNGLDSLCEELKVESTGPRLFVVKVLAAELPRSLPSRDAVYIKNRFRQHLGFSAG
jgi:thiamine pyrophosphate-dependent acetolactate synthase large subunit-like protein